MMVLAAPSPIPSAGEGMGEGAAQEEAGGNEPCVAGR
jgi:hypothetical protein